ncbi:hypothetical protein L210DRAFT_972064 [Boletus edulis BED1]|uniref:mRNA-decapping enzyme 1B n=1 Tax=Boletus edulis BED1 TaxID=1328754 RepID=A0AAD4GBP2_BOLED|nr:hypothetical protein L210DRAFT_972064 [Boletus edulis BED1]
MPPRRSRSNSSASFQNAQASSSPPPTSLGMSPASRYLSNMKVIRRRDSSIVSIFDQFSHVCVYHHNGDKWEKQGYEGSMFLYERDSYPPYGLYIMNRVGMEDYIQRLYPEDSVGVHGSYLMMRHYPDFTARRLAEARSKLALSARDGPATKFAFEYAIADPEKLNDADKGRSQTVGLWCFATDAREPMTDVVLRLQEYIKKNLPYPDMFRYGPDRPPPPSFRSTSRASERAHHARSASSASNASSIHSISESGEEDDRPAPSTSTSLNGPSGLDRLLAKLATPSQAQPSIGTGGSETTAASLLASISGPPRTMSVPPPSSSALSAPTRGLALLDTIFASATPPPPRAASRSVLSSNPPQHTASHPTSIINRVPSHSMPLQPLPPTAFSQDPHIHILSPKPTSTALPQVLNQEVISTLLGLPPSRASSVRYEGDNEASDDGASEPGSFTASIPQLSLPTAHTSDSEGGKPAARILGDVTPRPALRGFGSNINQVSDLLTAARIEQQTTNADTTPSDVHFQTSIAPQDSESTPTIYAQPRVNSTSTSKNPPKPRPLIPFETDSELWPYPRPPLVETDSDVIELDFADTSALSDPDAFEKHASKGKKPRRSKRDQRKEREEIEKSWDVPAPQRAASPIPSPPTGMLNGKAKRHAQPELVINSVPKQVHTSKHDDAPKININGAQSALLSSLASEDTAGRLRNLSRKDFVTEVLSLIYTNKQFVDVLYHAYTSQAT